jgi:ankyrin repeat protein
MTDFEYKPISLKRPAFRLLRLLKGSSGPIQCQLFESTLYISEHTTAFSKHICGYAALSYTWGNTSRPCDIIINGSNMTVTKNAYLALQDLRYQEQDRVLWVDAICINQEDKDERGQQVQQMGSIYSGAERVIIWLGEATYDTDYIMYYMKQLENEGFRHISNGQEISDKQWVNIWSVVIRDLRPDKRSLLAEGLQSLLHRSWFKRIWIIQETANAQMAEIICGGKSVSASIFALMPALLKITPDPHCQPILDIMPGSLRDSSWWAKKQDLFTMLDKFRNSEATDPRDNIYALLGISSNAYDTDLLRADYRKDLEDTIFDTTSFLLNLNELNPPIRRFFNWTLAEFLGNLNALANEVLKCAKDTGHGAVVKLLLGTGKADMNSKDYDSRMLLSWAAESGHEAVVKLLLERGAQLETEDSSGRTPLSQAAVSGHEAVVKLLLDGGAQLGTVNISGRTPLSWAAESGHEAIVKLLLERGAQLKRSARLKRGAQLETRDRYGRTPLSWATGSGHKAVVKLLLKRGAQLETEDSSDRTPLSWAAESGHEAVVKLLLERGAQLETEDSFDRTPLSWAAVSGHKAVVKLLLEGGAQLGTVNISGQTPLSQAAEIGHKAVVKLLLERGAQLEAKDNKGRTPLSWTVERGHEAVVKLLLERGAWHGAQDSEGLTPLLWATKSGHEAVVKLLLERGAWLETKGNRGQTPLSEAVQRGNNAIVKLLLERGAQVEAKDIDGRTPLSWAARYRHDVIVKLLLEEGAELETSDKYGRTPLSYAI